MTKKERIYSVDLIRFIAACGILLAHYLFRGYKADNLTTLNLTDLGGEWVKYCFVFIDLFFIISGFVINLSVRNSSLHHFFMSRFMRIFSVYWICLIITFGITLFFGAPRFTANFFHFLVNLTLLQELFDVPNIDGAYWTMFLELKFYCLAMVYLFFNRYKKLNIQKLTYWWIGLSILYLFTHNLFIAKVVDFFLMFLWSSAFAAGIIMGEIYKTKKMTLTQGIALILCFGLSVLHRLQYAAESRIYYKTEISDSITVLAMFIIYLIMLLAVFNKLKWLNKPIYVTLGAITYPLYLLHQHIGYIIFNHLDGLAHRYIILGGTILLMLILSFAIIKWFTPPISKLANSVFDNSMAIVKRTLMRFKLLRLRQTTYINNGDNSNQNFDS